MFSCESQSRTSLKGFASSALKPERLNSSIERGSTFPVIATIGIVTPDARSAEHTWMNMQY